MAQRKIKMVALDLDGTLLSSIRPWALSKEI